MSSCMAHREYLAAVADGETDLVPQATLDHFRDCADCQRQIRAHQLVTSRLRQALETPEVAVARHKPVWTLPARLPLIAAAVVVVILVAGAGVGWSVLTHPDPVQAALSASTQQLQIESSDPTQVGQWCLKASGRNLPAVHLDGMQVVGARMDRAASTDIVTVVYSAPSGVRVTVSWLEGQVPGGSGVEDRDVSGHQLLIVHAAVGTAVISSSSSDAMWQTAAAIESTSV